MAGILLAGCAGSHRVVADQEIFFEPVKVVAEPSSPKVAPSEKTAAKSALHVRADSLLAIQRSQQDRIEALTTQLQLLKDFRAGGREDSTKAAITRPAPPSKPATEEVRKPSLSYGEALRSYEAGDYRKALDGFQELLKRASTKNPEDDFYLLIGVSQYHLHQTAEALISLKRVVDAPRAKRKAEAYYILGLAQMRLGNYREANLMFDAMLKHNPSKELVEAAKKRQGGFQPAK